MTETKDPSHFPLVTIGVPAFNGARHVRRSIESLVGQDYPNLKIVISDDGSTDETASICDEMAMTDPRIEVHRRSHLGERRNFNAVLAAARGPYFMWAADHDVWDSRYVSACVAALQAHPKAVLACSHTMLIDEDGAELGVMDDDLGIDQPQPLDRYRALIWRLRWCNAIYGVMRHEAAAATGGYGSTPSPDHLVLAKMALRGSFVQLPETLFFRRQNRPPETSEEMRLRQSHDLEPNRADAWLALSPGAYYRTLRDGHLRAVFGDLLRPRDKVLALSATTICFAERFGVSSAPLRLALRARRILPASIRTALAGYPPPAD
jgi:glycosyltransferase involved in cell wall biosynthesis